MISPIPKDDDRLRNIGASTGGGQFYQHSDATVFNDFRTQGNFKQKLSKLGTTVEIVADRLSKTPSQVLEEALCDKYVRVDATILSGILNLSTTTHVGTSTQLQAHLTENGFSKDQICTLSRIPVAHIAGPADGQISGFVGEIAGPVVLDKHNNIIGTRVNGAEGRMVYVGDNELEEKLFEEFLFLLRTMPVHEILLDSTKLLFMPNAFYLNQSNVTHGRGKLDQSEYNIKIGGVAAYRRMHCRQYAKSRSRDNKEGFMTQALHQMGQLNGI